MNSFELKVLLVLKANSPKWNSKYFWKSMESNFSSFSSLPIKIVCPRLSNWVEVRSRGNPIEDEASLLKKSKLYWHKKSVHRNFLKESSKSYSAWRIEFQWGRNRTLHHEQDQSLLRPSNTFHILHNLQAKKLIICIFPLIIWRLREFSQRNFSNQKFVQLNWLFSEMKREEIWCRKSLGRFCEATRCSFLSFQAFSLVLSIDTAFLFKMKRALNPILRYEQLLVYSTILLEYPSVSNSLQGKLFLWILLFVNFLYWKP